MGIQTPTKTQMQKVINLDDICCRLLNRCLSSDDSNPTLAKQSDTESTVPKAPVKGVACHLWLKAGTCRFGDRCRFRHDDAQVCALEPLVVN